MPVGSADQGREPFRSRSHYRHWTKIGTRWHDNDIYGHVNNVVYYAWIDTAVNGWLIDAGLLCIEQSNPIGLVVETGCRYAVPICFPANVEVGLALAALGSSSVTYHLGIFVEGSMEAAAQARFTHVYVDRDTRRPCSLPERWRSKLNTLA